MSGDLTVSPAYSAGDRVVTAFGEPGRVVGQTAHDHIYVIELDGIGEAIDRLRTLPTDMFAPEPTI